MNTKLDQWTRLWYQPEGPPGLSDLTYSLKNGHSTDFDVGMVIRNIFTADVVRVCKSDVVVHACMYTVCCAWSGTCRILGDDEHAVDFVLPGKERAHPRRSLPWHSRRACRHQRSRDFRLATATTLHQSLYQGEFKVTLKPTLCCYLVSRTFPNFSRIPSRSSVSFVVSCFLNFCRAMLCKRGLCRHAVSVCPSVCHVREFCQNE